MPNNASDVISATSSNLFGYASLPPLLAAKGAELEGLKAGSHHTRLLSRCAAHQPARLEAAWADESQERPTQRLSAVVDAASPHAWRTVRFPGEALGPASMMTLGLGLCA